MQRPSFDQSRPNEMHYIHHDTGELRRARVAAIAGSFEIDRRSGRSVCVCVCKQSACIRNRSLRGSGCSTSWT